MPSFHVLARSLTPVAAGAVLLLPVAAQEGEPGPEEMERFLAEANAASRRISDETRAAREAGNDLTVLDAMRALEEELAPKGGMGRTMLYTEMATLAAGLGATDEALRLFDLSSPPRAASSPADALEGWERRDALELLADVAQGEQVVMVNEAHHVPQHRAFTLELLHVLREQGFTHFAAEALYAEDGGIAPRDDGLAERGYPTAATGTYLGEPVYADLVRTALDLGYVVVSYEAARTADRELGQATRLAERVFGEDPDARLVVHAGYGHISESGSVAGKPTMARRFRELTGIDPFTVDQTRMTEASRPEREEPLYRRVTEQGRVPRPTLFVRDGELWSSDPAAFDATLFQSRTAWTDGRPDWLRLGGRRRAVPVPADLLEAGPRLLVEARAADEGEDAIPLDRLVVDVGEEAPVLLLPPGAFTVVAEDAEGERVGRSDLRVE